MPRLVVCAPVLLVMSGCPDRAPPPMWPDPPPPTLAEPIGGSDEPKASDAPATDARAPPSPGGAGADETDGAVDTDPAPAADPDGAVGPEEPSGEPGVR